MRKAGMALKSTSIKETGVIHLNSIPIYFVGIISSMLVCLYALRALLPAVTKTGSTLVGE